MDEKGRLKVIRHLGFFIDDEGTNIKETFECKRRLVHIARCNRDTPAIIGKDRLTFSHGPFQIDDGCRDFSCP